jgi:serine/threonine-protein kinase
MVGRTIQQYQLLEKLGAGGMGEIYKALDTRLNRTVAIKVLPSAKSGDPERRRRFLQEAQAASGLNHPSIITIHDVISDGDTEFMVMEYVHGKTLNDLIPKGGLRVPLLIKYALQMADALSAAHAAGIVHRDLKPANAMVTDSGLVKVLDFGLAKLTDRGTMPDAGGDDRTRTIANAPMTVEGSILGTVSYMSPEQAQGKKVDARSDIFSFGAVLYEMATGVRAFEGESSLSTLSAILRDEAKPMSEVAPDVPPQLEDVIQRCLRKMPDDRWQSMKEIQTALSMLKRESDSGSLYTTRLSGMLPPPSTGPASRGPRTQASAVAAAAAPAAQASSNSKAMMGIAAVVVILLVGGGGVLWTMKKRAAEKAAAAQLAAQTPPPAPVVEPAPAPPPPPVDTTLTNDSVLDMVNQKVPSDLILSQIRSADKTNFDLSTPEVIRLSKAGVTPLIIEQMRNPKRVPLGPPPRSPNTPQNAKQDKKQGAPDTSANSVPVPVAALTPTPVPIAANPAVTLPPTPAPAPVVAAPQTVSVPVPDAAPFRMTLAADIPADAEVGRPIRFTVAEDFKLNNVTVLAKGSPVQGEISDTPKKGKIFGIGGTKLSFKLTQARSTAGHTINVRAIPSAKSDGISQRPVDTGQKTGSKDIAAAQGAQYIGYVDGAQTVTVPK